MDLEKELLNKKRSVGVVGCGGFVGGACYYTFNQSSVYEVFGYDIEPTKTKNNKKETFSADLVFVAVPTPMSEEGECHLGIVESVCEEIREYRKDNIIIIKSTILPGTTEKLNGKFGNVFFSPEFLTERRYIQDFIELPYQILGYPTSGKGDDWISDYESDWSRKTSIQNFFISLNKEKIIKAQNIIWLTSTQAEMVKYFRNNYLATRISFCNEMFDLCEKLDVTYEIVAEQAGLDSRIGQHYNKIDRNEREFSGVCLPKDLNATINLSKKLDINPVLLEAVWKKNLQVAQKKSWEKEKGRAIINVKK